MVLLLPISWTYFLLMFPLNLSDLLAVNSSVRRNLVFRLWVAGLSPICNCNRSFIGLGKCLLSLYVWTDCLFFNVMVKRPWVCERKGLYKLNIYVYYIIIITTHQLIAGEEQSDDANEYILEWLGGHDDGQRLKGKCFQDVLKTTESQDLVLMCVPITMVLGPTQTTGWALQTSSSSNLVFLGCLPSRYWPGLSYRVNLKQWQKYVVV